MRENALAATLLSPMISAETAHRMIRRVMAKHPKLCFMHPDLPRHIEDDENRKRKFVTAKTCLAKRFVPFPYTYILHRSTSGKGKR